MKYCPLSSVIAACPPGCTSTRAARSTAPAASTTRPLIAARLVCANAAPEMAQVPKISQHRIRKTEGEENLQRANLRSIEPPKEEVLRTHHSLAARALSERKAD